ncbi:SLOG family protein [Virgibacillus sp. CBA3643]|uniref:SLOG family protein n=1 Tax=Virgibacillus sp. CBA3643 TaxID=2942278 RepID=UPI0035A3CE1A
MRILTVTGYKPMELNIFKEDDPRIAFIKAAIEKRLIDFLEEGLEWVLISGQMGVELWTAEIVLDLKETYDVNIAIFPPFENQESRWPEELQEKYQELTTVCDFYKPIYHGDYKGAYQFKAKNMWLVDKSDGCLMLMDDEFPGSNRFFHEAAKNAKEDYPIFTITPADLDDAVEEMRMADPDYWD